MDNVSIEFLLSFWKDIPFRFDIMDMSLDNELNLRKVHHIDSLGHFNIYAKAIRIQWVPLMS